MSSPFRDCGPKEKGYESEKLAPDDPVFLEIVERQKAKTDRHVFGLYEFAQIKGAQGLKQKGYSDSVVENFIKNTLNRSIERLQNLSSDSKNPFAVVGFDVLIQKAMKDENIASELIEFSPGSFQRIDREPGGAVLINDGLLENLHTIPLDLYRRILEGHVAEFEKKQKELEQKLPDMEKLFTERLFKELAERGIKISKKQIERKIKNTKVFVGDFLFYSDINDTEGDYNPDSATAVLPSGDVGFVKKSDAGFEEYYQEVYTHEILHASSGSQVLAKKMEGDVVDAKAFRSGLYTGKRLKWLDEAFTERLALKLVGKNDSHAYKEERDILQIIIDKGVPEDLFFQAYFEDYSPTEKSPDGPAIRKLIKTINEKCGPGFLQDFDAIINESNVGVALNELRSQYVD